MVVYIKVIVSISEFFLDGNSKCTPYSTYWYTFMF